ncbi:PIN domain-like protein [Athelia psychrophila]|uniref:PIN domain-like protein n=1 Tax=Athelia psychrophila TaxID=1759441 RepID=A0A166J3V8_9AGAM|nr:PIN domain-like protein [Fibularhizoctonia sp. CBS 109695]
MGVPNLWNLLKVACIPISFRQFAIEQGFLANRHGDRTLWVGVDASNWLFIAMYRHGETQNPELITLFTQCERLAQLPVKAHFVFDGPERPSVKRGARIKRNENWLVDYFRKMIDAFGFTYSTALGEAEVELARMSQAQMLDVVLTEDSDSIVFGTAVVARKHGLEHDHTRQYDMLMYRMEDVTNHPSLGFNSLDLTFIALVAGGDYAPGIKNCGTNIASELVHSGLGRQLPHLLECNDPNITARWRLALCEELRSNSSRHLTSRHPTIAAGIPPDFPDLNVVRLYLEPAAHSSRPPPFSQAPHSIDAVAIAALASTSFQWGKRAIDTLERFAKSVFPALALRELIRDTNIADAGSRQNGRHHMITAIVRERKASETCFLAEARATLTIQPGLIKSICEHLPDWPLHDSALAALEEPSTWYRAWLPRDLVKHARPDLLDAFDNRKQGSSRLHSSPSSVASSSLYPYLAPRLTPTRSRKKDISTSTANATSSNTKGKKRALASDSEVEVSEISPSSSRGVYKRGRRTTIEVQKEADGTEVWDVSSESCSGTEAC